jgi:putative transposase
MYFATSPPTDFRALVDSMAAILNPLFFTLASLTRQDLARQVAYLKAENQLLRSKLPKRITFTDQHCRSLVKHGKPLGPRLAAFISIVSYETFRKWVRRFEDGPSKRPVSAPSEIGRPRIEESVSEAIFRIKNETGWGYTKIVQALRQLGHVVARETVKNVLIEAGLGPEPGDHRDTWSDFLRRHAATLWQCDFASKRMWTIKGMVDIYFLVFIHVESRRVWVSASTAHPTGELTAQQARNFDMFLQEERSPCTIVQRDRDSKYVQAFDDVFTGNGRTVKLTPVRSPNLQAFVERVIQTLKHEVLNGFCVVSERQLNHILRVGADWYNRRRGHTGREHRPPIREDEQPPMADLCKHKLVCHNELGGHLKSYRPAA